MGRLVSSLILMASGILIFTGVAGAQTGPEFRLGFKALAELIPEVVGQPLENEHHAPNGDGLQATTGGLMVWRKADNWTAFTNGHRSWVNGPFGLQERSNQERFDWEIAGPEAQVAPTPSPTPSPTLAPIRVATATPTPVPRPNLRATEPYVIEGRDLYRETVWIQGELRNDDSRPAYNARVTARLLSTSGQVLRTADQVFAYLGPGETVGYRVEVGNAPEYATVQLSVDSSATGFGRHVKLPITWVKNVKEANDRGQLRYQFTGILGNDLGEPVSLNVAYVWFLDDHDRVVWMDYAYFPGSVPPGESIEFTIRTLLDRDNPLIDSICQVRYYAVGRLP